MLQLTHVTHIYANGTRALDDATLDIPTGMFGLLGPNGAGKSTLMRCIATLQTPSEGQIAFDGIDVIREPEKLRAQLGYLPQDFGVYPRVSAYDLLDHLAVLKGVAGKKERKDTVETLLNQVNLWNVRKKSVAGYSGGMRQRFGIAQALIGNPRLIIVDDVADLCSRMAIINEGRIVSVGAPAELVSRLRGRVWRRAIDKHGLADYQSRMDVISTRLRGGQTVIHVVADSAPETGFEPVVGGLEDLYFSTLTESRRNGGKTLGPRGRGDDKIAA
jgi:ABC-type multidrug transport system ATPase subunit